jgi:hypothetical protein
MQDLAAFMLDDEEAVEKFECHRRHGEKVERDDHFPMILQERQPPLTSVTTATNSPKAPGHGSFGDDEAELLQFTVDFWSYPVRILFCQMPDQTADFIGDLGPTAARAGPPAPVQPKAGAMPADDGLWFHDDEYVGLAAPHAAQGRPEDPVNRVQRRPRSLALEHCDLLSQGEYLQGGVRVPAGGFHRMHV